jgi:hypothetical protein
VLSVAPAVLAWQATHEEAYSKHLAIMIVASVGEMHCSYGGGGGSRGDVNMLYAAILLALWGECGAAVHRRDAFIRYLPSAVAGAEL